MRSEQTTEPLTYKNKGMLALVIFLGVLIIIATTVLIFVIVSRIMHKNDHPTSQASTITTSFVSSSVTRPVSVLQEPNGTHINQVFRQSDQIMVISLTGGGLPDRVIMWDVANQQKLSEVKLSEVTKQSE